MSAAAGKSQFLLDLQTALGGCIPFDRWMHEALYNERFGYYTANFREFGRRGDFTTWPALNDGLGGAIGRWILMNKPSGRLNVIEIGAGSGELAASVIKTIGWWSRPRYHIVEISPRLRRAQEKRIGSRAVWHATVSEALEASRGAAIIFSNELVDAFPCRVFKKEADGWCELALRIEGTRIVEEWITRPLPDSTAFIHPWPVGQRIEVRESFAIWLRGWLPDWKLGSMLTIDYGDACPAIYQRRPRGTLRAYAHHQRLEGHEVYSGFGLRDLTADVNFSDLQRESALSTTTFVTLAGFISNNNPSAVRDHTAQILHAPNGAGEAFKVLIQTR